VKRERGAPSESSFPRETGAGEGTNRHRLGELMFLFLKLGVIGFGGPAAHIAMMEDEVVRRRQWLSREKFLDLLGATNLIPGPNSTEMAIHVGYLRAGWAGLFTAGTCFILPAALIVTVMAWAYVGFGKLPEAAALFYGIKPVVIAVVLQALWGLGRTAMKSGLLAVISLVATVLNFAGINELMVLFGAGFVAASIHRWNHRRDMTPPSPHGLFSGVLSASGVGATGAATATAFGLWPLFLFFIKVGSVLFGSGYVLLAFLRADLVERWHWLTMTQLLDAVAVGQITPGPVFTTATFIGYLLAGPSGALIATVGIFLPAFFFVAISGPLLSRLRNSPVAGAFLDGINVASLALMAVVSYNLGRVALVDLFTVVLAVASVVALIRFRVSSAWLVPAGGLAGLAVAALMGRI